MAGITDAVVCEAPVLDIMMISHGTLESRNLQESRRFYEEVLGFEVLQLSTVSLLVRHGSDHTYVVVETPAASHDMALLNHNGLDVATKEDVDAAHEKLEAVKERYGIRRINKIRQQHGTYSFYFQDLDGNWWEVQPGRGNGYSWMYEETGRDITGRHDLDIGPADHLFDDAFAERVRCASPAGPVGGAPTGEPGRGAPSGAATA